jgi:hypothetical protein
MYKIFVKTAIPTALNPGEDDYEFDWVDYTGEEYDSLEEAQKVIDEKNLLKYFRGVVVKGEEEE